MSGRHDPMSLLPPATGFTWRTGPGGSLQADFADAQDAGWSARCFLRVVPRGCALWNAEDDEVPGDVGAYWEMTSGYGSDGYWEPTVEAAVRAAEKEAVGCGWKQNG